jgi:parallel beta-helix repeat protein
MKKRLLFLTFLVSSFSIHIAYAASAVTVVNASTFGLNATNTDLVNGVAVASMATYAASHPNTKIVINTGIYKIKRNAAQIIDFNYCNSIEIDGQGSTFVLSETDKKYNGSFIQLDHCQNMTIRNLIFDWDWDIMPLNAIGKITAITKTGQTGATYEIVNNINTTARPKNTVSSRAWSNTLKCRSSVGGFALAADTAIWIDSKHVFIGIGSTTSLNAAKVGLYTMLAFETNFTGSAIVADYCTSLNIDNVSVYSIPGPSFSISGSKDYSVTNCSIIPKPGTDRYTSTTSGGEYHNSAGTVLIENNKMIYTTDDGIHISDNYIPPHMKNDPVNPRVVVADTLQFYTTSYVLNVGDTLDFRYQDFSPTGVTAVLVATKWDMNYFLNNSSNLGDHRCTLTFDRDIPPIPKGAFLFNRRYGRAKVRIANNVFAYNFCHGLCYCVPNGVIENNCISRTAYSGIRSYLTFRSKKWVMGTGPSNVIIRNNTLYECNNGVDQVAPASLYVGAGIDGGGYNFTVSTNRTALTNVTVSGNTVFGSDSQGLYVTSITGATVENNTLIDVGRNPLPTTVLAKGALTVESANNVTLTNNKIIQPSGTSRKGLVIDAATTSGVTSTGLQQLTQQTVPVALSANSIQPTSFLAKWKKVAGAGSYFLFVYKKNYNQTTDSLINQYSVADSSFVVTNLLANQKYGYKVSIQPSFCNDEILTLSNMIYVTTTSDLSTIYPVASLDISIYPTLCDDELFLNNCDSAKYSVFNVLGKIQLNGLITASSITVASLHSGTYFIRIEFKQGSIVRKFVKR